MYFNLSCFTGNPKETGLHFVSGTRQASMLFASDELGRVDTTRAATKTKIRNGLTSSLYSTSDLCNRKFWAVSIHIERAQINQCGVKVDALDLSVLSERLIPEGQVGRAR